MTRRVPRAELPASLRQTMIDVSGAVPEPVEVLNNNPAVAELQPGVLGQSRSVGRGRREPQDLCAHGGRGTGRLQLVPRRQLLPGAEPAARPEQGEPGPALEGVRRVHGARAGRARVRGGDDRTPRRPSPTSCLRACSSSSARRRSSSSPCSSPSPTSRRGPTPRTGSPRRAIPTCARFRWPRRHEPMLGPVPAPLSTRALNRALLARQGLLDPLTMPLPEAIEHLVGLQAQAPNAPYYGLWSRLARFATDDLAELLLSRRVVRTVLMRSTVHLVTARDCLALRPLVAPMLERQLWPAAPGARRSSAWISGARGRRPRAPRAAAAHQSRARALPRAALSRARRRVDGAGAPQPAAARPAAAARDLGRRRRAHADHGRVVARRAALDQLDVDEWCPATSRRSGRRASATRRSGAA